MSTPPAGLRPTSRCSSTCRRRKASGGSAAVGSITSSARSLPCIGASAADISRSVVPSPSACGSSGPGVPPTRSRARSWHSWRSICVAFEAIEDQPRAVALLRRALEGGRVAHAYAFVGPAGSGRTATALAFTQALLCETSAGCGRCRACAQVAAQRHPDVHVIVPTPPETNPKGARAIRIGAIRELERQAALRPVAGRYKIFILDDADRMTGESPQAFLKTLEEPPADTVLILVLARARAVPATVLSRCQLVRFAPRRDGAAETRAEAMELLAEVRDKGVEALFRRSQAFDRDRERAE